jgi:nicotinamide-nucleotide amidase
MPFYIFSTGTELSSGRSRDTNGPFIAQSLSEAGLDVSAIITLPDNPTSILEELSRLIARTDTSGIIITGGLGPTEDDHTVDILCKLTEKSAVEDPFALSRLEAAAKRLPGRLQLSSARRQTRVVEGCTVIKNERGLAPGMIVEIGTNGPFIAAMPGVPSEMRGMFDGTLFPYIKSRDVLAKVAL